MATQNMHDIVEIGQGLTKGFLSQDMDEAQKWLDKAIAYGNSYITEMGRKGERWLNEQGVIAEMKQFATVFTTIEWIRIQHGRPEVIDLPEDVRSELAAMTIRTTTVIVGYMLNELLGQDAQNGDVHLNMEAIRDALADAGNTEDKRD